MRRIPSLLFLVLAAGVAAADPPKITIPAEVRPAGQYVRFTPETDAESVTYVGLSGLDSFPTEELKNPRRFVLDTRGLAEARYKFAAVAASKTGEQTRVDFVVVVGKGTEPPPVDPPVDPPPQPAKGLYFVVVRPDGPASPAFTKLMSDPAWAELVKAGHQFKDKTVTEAAALRIPAPTTLPAVVTLRVNAAGTASTIVRDAIPAPTTGDGILKLPEGVK